MAKYKIPDHNLNNVLQSQGGKSVAFLKQILTENNKIATGNLINSLDYEVIKELNGMTLTILASDHFKYVDAGRRAGAKPPPVKAILPWVKLKNVFSPLKPESAAFIIARSIGVKGIKPLYMKDKLLKMLNKNLTEIIKGATQKDIQELLDKLFPKKTIL